MAIVTITTIPPQIVTYFNTWLLDPFRALWVDLEERILPRAKRKIRSQDRGKKREFDQLYKKFKEEYGRKEKEKAEYDAKIKNTSKRPSVPTTGGTCTFRRYEV
ncbi:hypothetical protein UFOVP816_49 [uncultured Caudovirales phage]|uniref:Uncharacterized protein n=1 Tax=uncultured Caudovirales phage TaxID=2100421 RepID=A0A6J5P5P2_9CAUD|nr:hypothetical protein UFOVP816_49 [uncultured Caudovirales phage]